MSFIGHGRNFRNGGGVFAVTSGRAGSEGNRGNGQGSNDRQTARNCHGSSLK
ncbi:hypothetical protein HMPREF0307_01880 [Corynebacterium sp. DNF00584]|nr:hypothetical protein HMPREF0307_01880 [Corynebacterium sp. DNF00584]